MLALAFLPAGALALQSGLASMSARHAAVQGAEGVQVLQSLSGVRDEVTQMREMARSLAANERLLTQDPQTCVETLSRISVDRPMLIAVMDRDGQVLCENLPSDYETSAAGERLILTALRRNDAVIGFIARPALTSEPVLASLAPAQFAARRDPLFVTAQQPSRALLQRVEDVQRPGGFTALVDRNGTILQGVNLDLYRGDAERLSAIVREAPLSALGAAFRLDRRWAVATELQEGELYLVKAWAPAPQGWRGGLRAAWALAAPILLWLAAVGATWYAVEVYVARPLLVVESLSRAYARGEDSEEEEQLLSGAPAEIASLRRALAAMAKTLRRRETRLAEALREERALLLEVNHRVKNNLQLVASILSIQSRGTENADEARGLSRAQDRVQLLALAHARIYASGEVRDIALDQLAAEIARTLISARGAETAHLKLDMDLSPLRMGVDQAMPLAFLIGERIGLILDHARHGGRIDALSLTLAPHGETGFSIEIDADGAPSPEVHSATTLRLMAAFARQIEAEVESEAARPFWVRILAHGRAEEAPVSRDRQSEESEDQNKAHE